MSGFAAARRVAPRRCRCAPSTAPTGAPGIVQSDDDWQYAAGRDHQRPQPWPTTNGRRCKSWISYSDADGNAATQYQFWDGGTGANSGYFWTPTMPTIRQTRLSPSRPPTSATSGFAAGGRRLRDHVGPRLRRHRLERLGCLYPAHRLTRRNTALTKAVQFATKYHDNGRLP